MNSIVFSNRENAPTPFESTSDQLTDVYEKRDEKLDLLMIEEVLKNCSNTEITLDETSIECNICGNDIGNTTLEKHVQRHHCERTRGNYICGICDEMYPPRLAWHHYYTKHLQQASSRFCISCKLCKESLPEGTSYLSEHIRKEHFGDYYFKCKFCDENFILERQLKDHLLSIHEKDTANCTKCPLRYIYKHDLNMHIKEKHSNNNIIKELSKPVFKCLRGCNAVFYSADQMNEHIALPHTHRCMNCNLRFPLFENLQTHNKNSHENTKSNNVKLTKQLGPTLNTVVPNQQFLNMQQQRSNKQLVIPTSNAVPNQQLLNMQLGILRSKGAANQSIRLPNVFKPVNLHQNPTFNLNNPNPLASRKVILNQDPTVPKTAAPQNIDINSSGPVSPPRTITIDLSEPDSPQKSDPELNKSILPQDVDVEGGEIELSDGIIDEESDTKKNTVEVKSPERQLSKDSDDSKDQNFEITNSASSKTKSGYTFDCKQCAKKFRTQATLERHVFYNHSVYNENLEKAYVLDVNWNTFNCKSCTRVYKFKKDIRWHVNTKHKKCDLCGELMQKESFLYEHIDAKHSRCNMCQEIYLNEEELKKHTDNTHVNKIECDKCGIEVLVSNLDSHKSYCYPKCKLCETVLLDEEALKDHTAKHHNNNKIKCDVCGLKIPESYLSAHKDFCSFELNSNTLSYNCILCVPNRSFASKDLLNSHMDSFHTKCDICYKYFIDESALEKHKPECDLSLVPHSVKNLNLVKQNPNIDNDVFEEIVEESPKVKCDKCGEQFVDKLYLHIHVRAAHKEENQYKCDNCNKKFIDKLRLYDHIRSEHKDSSSDKFKCPLCSKSFPYRMFLDQHITSKHKQ